MGVHLGEIGLTNLAGPTGPAGAVTGSGAATDVAFWTNASNISGNANLTWDNVNKILAAVGAITASVSVTSPLFAVASGAGNSGLTTTVTTASLVGKTMTFQGGILTGFA